MEMFGAHSKFHKLYPFPAKANMVKIARGTWIHYVIYV